MDRELLNSHAELGGPGSLLGSYGKLVAALCSSDLFWQPTPGAHLQSSALLALCKLMVADEAFCEAHLRTLFKLLLRNERSRNVDPNK